MMLRDALDTLTVEELRALAQTLHVSFAPSPGRRELTTVLVGYLTSAQGVAATLRSLDTEARDALGMLVSMGGSVPTHMLERDYGHFQHRTPYPIGGQKPRLPAVPTTTTRLFDIGLIYPSHGKVGSWEGDLYIVPEDILVHLPAADNEPIEDILETADEPALCAAQGDIVRDIGLLLCYLQRETVRGVRGDQLPKRDVTRLNAELSVREDLTGVRTEMDTRWIAFVHHMAKTLGLVQSQGGIIGPTETAVDWLALPFAQQMRGAWQAYLQDAEWNEMSLGTGDGYSAVSTSPRQLYSARERVLATLKHCLPQRWYTISSLNRALRKHDLFFLRQRGGSLSVLYWSGAAFWGSWKNVEAPIIQTMLCQAFAMLGVVEVGGNAGDESSSVFRLTSRGAALTGLIAGEIEQPAAAPIVVQANFDIVLPREATPHTIFHLQDIADIEKRDRASIYRLTPDSIWHQLQAGRDIESIITFLEQASRRTLPQNVAYSLREWAERYGEVTIERVDLLIARSPTLMAGLRANRKLGVPVGDELNSSVISLRDAELPALVGALRKAGYWPKADAGLIGATSDKASGQSITLQAHEFIRLLVGALVLARLEQATGWPSPVTSSVLRALVPRLPPAMVRQARRMADDATVDYYQSLSSSNGYGGAPSDDMPTDGNGEPSR